ncbi:translocation/assembly module TamB domain-containing protein [Microscilla marina]|uniref:Lipoprotein, putative n=1 Tax=Microscilla marina ATCC 23134 TaxID=313606 RepID=A1ZPI8_MICM2|nr:hypothetical protein [Microscilla marina]EAY27727.1 lipoprotein, putative [Microscilla marina ATCC 23134]
MLFLKKIVLFVVFTAFIVSCAKKENVAPAKVKQSQKSGELKTVLDNAQANPNARTSGAIQLGIPFEIGLDDIRYSLDARFVIRLDNVQDARCPKGMMCVRAGGAKVSFSAYQGQYFNFDLETVNVLPTSAPVQRTFNGYTLKLIDVNPYPAVNIKFPKSAYKATLVLTKDAAPVKVVLNTPFELKLGANARFRNGAIDLEFKEVMEDSRCPEGTNCISAGRVKLLFVANNDQKMDLTLEAGKPQLARFDYQGFTIELLKVVPYPVAGTTNQGIYKATLVITQSPSFGNEFEMSYGTTVNIKDFDLTFNEVEDSRCPEGAQCIWAGNVKVNFKVGGFGFTLTKEAGKPELAQTTINDYVVKLVEVTPYPSVGTTINKANYRAKVIVTKAN